MQENMGNSLMLNIMHTTITATFLLIFGGGRKLGMNYIENYISSKESPFS